MSKDWIDTMENIVTHMETISPGNSLNEEAHLMLDEMRAAGENLLPDWKGLPLPILCIDFDGVISENKRGWEGVEVDSREEPVKGAIFFLSCAVKNFKVIVHSARCNRRSGIHQMKKWLLEYGMSEHAIGLLSFQPGKPSAAIFLDDRAVRFDGTFEDPGNMHYKYLPWYYGLEDWNR